MTICDTWTPSKPIRASRSDKPSIAESCSAASWTETARSSSSSAEADIKRLRAMLEILRVTTVHPGSDAESIAAELGLSYKEAYDLVAELRRTGLLIPA